MQRASIVSNSSLFSFFKSVSGFNRFREDRALPNYSRSLGDIRISFHERDIVKGGDPEVELVSFDLRIPKFEEVGFRDGILMRILIN